MAPKTEQQRRQSRAASKRRRRKQNQRALGLIVLLVLLVMTHSWIQPFLFYIIIGVSIILNMGTNLVFPSISFITFAVAAILQLALAMDYSIMLLNAYDRLEVLEYSAAAMIAAKDIGDVVYITDDEVKAIEKAFHLEG